MSGAVEINDKTINLEKELENVQIDENHILILLKYNEVDQSIAFNIQTTTSTFTGTFIDRSGYSDFTTTFSSILDNHPKKAGIINLYNAYDFKAHGNQPQKKTFLSKVFGKTGGKKTKSNRSYNANKTLKNRK